MTGLLIHNCDILRVQSGRTSLDTGQDIWVDQGRIVRIQPICPGPAG